MHYALWFLTLSERRSLGRTKALRRLGRDCAGALRKVVIASVLWALDEGERADIVFAAYDMRQDSYAVGDNDHGGFTYTQRASSLLPLCHT
jgi:hypothetical protein